MSRAAEPTPEQPVTREILLDAALPAERPVGRVEILEVRIAPGGSPGPHVHNGPVFGSVLAGSVIYQLDGQPERTLRPGDVFYEPEGALVTRFDATGEGVTFLAYYLLGAGEPAEITFR